MEKEKCEFCQGNKSINNEYGNMHIYGDLELSISVYGEQYTNVGYFKINYCPICGRKLSDIYD